MLKKTNTKTEVSVEHLPLNQHGAEEYSFRVSFIPVAHNLSPFQTLYKGPRTETYNTN